MLYELVYQSGIYVRFQAKVVSVDPSTSSLTFEDGTKVTADIIVSAEGAQSTIRPIVVGRTEVEETGPFPLYRYVDNIGFCVEFATDF